MPYNSKRPPPLLIHPYPRRRMNKESDEEVEELIQGLSITNTDTKAAELNAIEEHVAQFNYLYAYPPFRRILYEVLFELYNNRPPLLCTFSRAYIQDVDLYNECLKGSGRAFIVPTPETIELLNAWAANCDDSSQPKTRRASLSDANSSSTDETEEQAQMRQMGLPVTFGDGKSSKRQKDSLRNDMNKFAKLTSNLGYIDVFDYSTKPSKGKTLKPSNIKQLKYKFRSERSAKIPRYRYINQRISPNTSSSESETMEQSDDTAQPSTSNYSPKDLKPREAAINGGGDAPEPSTKPDLDVDFGFDPVRDAALIASNYNQQFSEDDVEIKKYWHQRYRLFSKLNQGILMDREGWFSVTPERVAQHIARRMVTHKGMIILDAFTGVGGNAIQFAREGAHVYAIDLDPIKIRCARRNAEIYGVLDRITFICGDFFKVAQSYLGSRPRKSKTSVPDPDESPYGIDAIFLSPPWGGPAYETKSFDIQNSMGGLDGIEIFRLAEKISANIAYFLPRNTPSCQIIALASNFHRVEIEQSILNGKNKTVTAYYGNLVKSHSGS